MTDRSTASREKPQTKLITEEEPVFVLRLSVAEALERHKTRDSRDTQVWVHRGTTVTSERAIIVWERLCLLPDTHNVGILQIRSRHYYPVDAIVFHTVAIRAGTFGSVTDLTQMFDDA